MRQMEENNPLYKFHFCPICGSNRFVEHSWNSRKCEDCGFTYYTNPRGATVAIIINEKDELLVGTRVNEPAKGTYDLVGGFMDLYETGEEAMCREIKEESGLEVEPSQLRFLFTKPNQYPYSKITCHTIDLFFECKINGNEQIKSMDDIEGLQWIPLDRINLEKFGLHSVREGLAKYLSNR